VGEGRTEGAQSEPRYLSVGEAAKLLGVHRNTVHHRIKTGRIKAHKVLEADREVYRIEADSLGLGRTSADVRTLDAQRTMAGQELAIALGSRLDEIVQGHAQELGAVREQLGIEKGRREKLEEENERLRAALEAERSKGFWRKLFGG
jgi:excisionase family DNA binding protein